MGHPSRNPSALLQGVSPSQVSGCTSSLLAPLPPSGCPAPWNLRSLRKVHPLQPTGQCCCFSQTQGEAGVRSVATGHSRGLSHWWELSQSPGNPTDNVWGEVTATSLLESTWCRLPPSGLPCLHLPLSLFPSSFNYLDIVEKVFCDWINMATVLWQSQNLGYKVYIFFFFTKSTFCYH